MSDHNSWAPCFWLGNLVEKRKCSELGLKTLSWLGWLTSKAKVKFPYKPEV